MNRAFQQYVFHTEMLSSFRVRIRNISQSVIQLYFRLWEWGTKTTKRPFPLARRGPHVIQQCLGPLQAPPETAAPTAGTLSHTDAIKSPLVTMARPKFAPKTTPSHGPIHKPHYLPHPWTPPTYDAKWHPDPIRCFSTMYWTDWRMDRQIVHGKVWWLYAAMLRQRRGLIILRRVMFVLHIQSVHYLRRTVFKSLQHKSSLVFVSPSVIAVTLN